MSKVPLATTALPWSDSFSVGIEALDIDHRDLVCLINEVCSHARAQRREAAEQAFAALGSLAAAHFEREEAILRELAGYRHLEAHAGEHRNRLKQLAGLQQRYDSTFDDVQVARICEDLVHWFVRQSIGHDAEVRSYRDDRGQRFSSPAGGPP